MDSRGWTYIVTPIHHSVMTARNSSAGVWSRPIPGLSSNSSQPADVIRKASRITPLGVCCPVRGTEIFPTGRVIGSVIEAEGCGQGDGINRLYDTSIRGGTDKRASGEDGTCVTYRETEEDGQVDNVGQMHCFCLQLVTQL